MSRLIVLLLLLFAYVGYWGHSRRKKRGHVGLIAPALLIAEILYVADALR